MARGPRQINKPDLPLYVGWSNDRAGLLTSSFRDRFGIIQRLEFYSSEELSDIVERSTIISSDVDAEGSSEIANRSRDANKVSIVAQIKFRRGQVRR